MVAIVSPYNSLPLPELESQVETGNIDAIAELGRRLCSPNSTEAELQRGVACLTQAADAGHAKAQNNLGVCYAKGMGVVRDVTTAISLYKLAARQGLPHAMYNLSILYANRDSVEYNPRLDAKYLLMAAKHGYSKAQVFVADLYLEKSDTKQYRKRQAISLLLAAAECTETGANAGSVMAKARLGTHYCDGIEGVIEKNAEKAVEYLTPAAEQGHACAQYYLAALYINGDDIKKDTSKGMELLEASARQGFSAAQYALSIRWLHGIDCKQDTIKALDLLDAAATHGNHEAKLAIFSLYSKMIISRLSGKTLIETTPSERDAIQVCFDKHKPRAPGAGS